MRNPAIEAARGHTEPLEALRELARSAAEDPSCEVLELVADVILGMGGFRTLAMNVYRPRFDDFQVVLVRGNEAARAMLEGESIPREDFMLVTRHGEEREPGIYFVAPESDFWDVVSQSFVPELPVSDDPDAWQPEDALLVVLREDDDAPLGFVSMDEPVSGKRPSAGDLRLLALICSFAEQALRNASRAARLDRERRMMARITEVSARISSCATREELHRLVAATIADDLGFERVAVYVAEDADTLTRSAEHNGQTLPRPPVTDRIAGATVTAALARRRSRAGCWIVPADDVLGPAPAGPPRSRRDGRGPLAWQDHCVLIPWRTGPMDLSGIVIAGDPVDGLLPDENLCRALRLLVDLAASVQQTIDQRARLNRLAAHDTLTGLRNRRGLDRLLASSPRAAVLVLDLDRFKQVNDGFGHETGDRVLRRFSDLLGEVTRSGDVAMRLGGDEFCLVLPETRLSRAMEVAEQIRAGAPARCADLVPFPVTVSIGVAVGTDRAFTEPTEDLARLLTAADRALYRAKHEGGDGIAGVALGAGGVAQTRSSTASP